MTQFETRSDFERRTNFERPSGYQRRTDFDMRSGFRRRSNFVQDLGDAARENPISAALIGMGILWMFGGSAAAMARRAAADNMPDPRRALSGAADAVLNTGAAIGEGINSATSKITRGASAALDGATRFGREQTDFAAQQARAGRGAAGEMADAVASGARRVQDSASTALEGAARFGREQSDSVAQYARSIPEAGGQMVHTLRSNLSELFEAQPLALGVVGLAIGAGIAAAVPPTQMEAEYLGEASDAVKEKAKQFASEQTGRASEMAEQALNAASEEARKQGLTTEGVKSAASEVSQKVYRVADAAGKGASERAGSTPR